MNQRQLIECVPNFSEGRDRAVIDRIAEAIRVVDGVRLLNVDPGRDTNRTVMTFVGEPEPVIEAAFQAARVARDLIDMSRHSGAHPRFGAMDVCPLVPISGVSMEEAVEFSKILGKHLGDELGLTIYLYEKSATAENRRNLASLRAGEYEGLEAKLNDPDWRPDFGPDTFNPKYGASAVGARDFLVAYNVNLNTTSTRRANAIAFDVREKGRMKRGPEGKAINEPGSLKSVKAIGWFIEEYGIAQISMNLTDLSVTPVHVAFDETCEKARARGIRVTGSELIGLIPLGAILEAGRYFLRKQQRSIGVSDRELIKIAIRSMGLNELAPFDPNERIIEYAIRDKQSLLVDRSLSDFTEETSSESPAPGGGSVSAAVGALGAALATMVANLSSHKRGWDDRWEEFSDWAERGKSYYVELLRLVDADTAAFNQVMAAFGMPKSTDTEVVVRKAAIQEATKAAIDAPLQVMRDARASMDVILAMADIGNPNSISDAGVGALCARAAVFGAGLNVRINLGDLEDRVYGDAAKSEAAELETQATEMENKILEIVRGKL